MRKQENDILGQFHVLLEHFKGHQKRKKRRKSDSKKAERKWKKEEFSQKA